MPIMQKSGKEGICYLIVPKKLCEERGWTKGTIFKTEAAFDGVKFRELR
ncbi:MAG: hypothetical protein ACYDEF_03700 [Methanosarcina sp.]